MIPETKNTHLLIVDDDDAMRSALRRSLLKMGYNISCAVNGKDALVKMKQKPVDLVLMDFRMPMMDGIEALKNLREQGYKTPVIIMTAFGDVQIYLKSKELGIAEFITKPIRMGKLQEIIRTVLLGCEGGSTCQSA